MGKLSEHDAKLAREYIGSLLAFMGGTSDQCLHCQKAISYAVKRGRAVYAYPCGCRLYQGDVPEWLKQQQIN